MKFFLLKEFLQEGHLTVHVTGGCMQESIPQGTQVRLARRHLYWPGDIVAFRRGSDDVVSHRFLGYLPGRRGWRVITRADNAQRADSPALLLHVLGRVTHVRGEPFQPGFMHRTRAVLAWFPGAAASFFIWLGASPRRKQVPDAT